MSTAHDPALASEIAPRIITDLPIEAYAAIIVRHLGDGYFEPRFPKLADGDGWVKNFKATFDNPCTKPIETVFRANPLTGPNNVFDGVQSGEVSWPLFAIWRSRNHWKRYTNAADQNLVTLEFCWVLPPHSQTERNWPLLTEFDFHLRRVLRGIYRCTQDKELLSAALVRDFTFPWQTYETELGYKGPAGKALHPTLTGRFQFDIFWEKTQYNHGLILEAFNFAYANYFLRYRKESGSMDDARLNPPLSSLAKLLVPGQGFEGLPPR